MEAHSVQPISPSGIRHPRSSPRPHNQYIDIINMKEVKRMSALEGIKDGRLSSHPILGSSIPHRVFTIGCVDSRLATSHACKWMPGTDEVFIVDISCI